MKKSIIAAVVAVAGMAIPSMAQAGCTTCYQPQVIPPQYRTVERTVMVSPGHTVRRHRPAQYRTVMVPKTVMVAPARTESRRAMPPSSAPCRSPRRRSITRLFRSVARPAIAVLASAPAMAATAIARATVVATVTVAATVATATEPTV